MEIVDEQMLNKLHYMIEIFINCKWKKNYRKKNE